MSFTVDLSSGVAEIPLENGVVVTLADATRRYFGDYHLVRVDVTCAVPVAANIPADAAAAEREALLAVPPVFRRSLEKMGVESSAVDAVRQQLLNDFSGHVLPYVSSEAFPSRLVASALAELRRRTPRSYRR